MFERSYKSLTEAVFQRMRADIIAGVLEPGAKLPIASLTSRYGVSLSAVRESLARLAADGFVIATAQRGFHVAPLSIDDLNDLTRTRVLVETEALTNAMSRADDAYAESVRVAINRLRLCGDSPDRSNTALTAIYNQAHHEFHSAIVSACDSPWLLRIREGLYDQAERYRSLSLPMAPVPRAITMEHEALADAVLACDSARAGELLRDHLMKTARVLSDAVRARAARLEPQQEAQQ
jgi:DNA-binding GntR family transcriptional regulator